MPIQVSSDALTGKQVLLDTVFYINVIFEIVEKNLNVQTKIAHDTAVFNKDYRKIYL